MMSDRKKGLHHRDYLSQEVICIKTRFINLKCVISFFVFRLELNMELPQGQTGTIGASTQVSQEQDELTQRLARLRQV